MSKLKKINILHLITGLGVGGAERVVLDLVKNLDANMFNVYVVSMSKRVEMLDQFQQSDIDVKALRKDNSAIAFLEIFLFLKKYIRDNNIDIVHAHMTHSVVVASLLKIINPKLKIVFTSHNINLESTFRELILFISKPLRSIDILFSLEQTNFFYKKNYCCIPNGINILKYNLKIEKESVFTFIAVGRLELQKNHQLLIQAARQIPQKYKFEIWIAGDGELLQELKKLSIKLQVESRIKFLGLRKDIPVLLNRVHCFVMPSLWEGLPIALLEAGASELPVIAPPVGSIPSLLDNNNSYLVNHEDFYKSMMEVMDDYTIAQKKAKRLKEKIINDYSLDSIVKKHEKIYLQVITN